MKILLVDDHTHVREVLRQMLELRDGMEVVGERSNGQEAVEGVAELDPDIVLMDMRMPIMDGIEATRIIKERHPEVKVLALTAFGEMSLIASMVKVGASGYVLKGGSPAQLMQTIEAVAQGKRALERGIGRTLLEETGPPLAKTGSSPDPNRTSNGFISVGSDEIDGPIADIKATVTSLRSGWTTMDDEAKLGHLDSLMIQCDRLEDLLGRTLTVSGIQVGPGPTNSTAPRKTFSLADVARDATALLGQNVDNRVTLKLGEVEADGDPDQMREAAVALIENALSYTDGSVVARVSSDDRAARLEVQDEGPGLSLPPEGSLAGALGRRGRNGRPGLSLTIVKACLERAGGRLEIDSGPDRGSTFAMVLRSP